MMEGLKRGSAAIVGVAESDLGQVAEGTLRLRSDGARSRARARRLRPEIEGRRRAVLSHHPEPVVGPRARRIPRNQSSIPGFDHRRRFVLRVSRGACDGRDCARPLQRRRDCLWQHAAQRRPQAGVRARDQSVRNAVQAVPAVERLRACGVAAYASVRHDARATGRGRGGRAGMGAAQPGGVGEEAADDRRRALVPHGELSLHGAGLLSRHRRRRRHRRHIGRTRQVAQEAGRLCARLRPVDHPRQHFKHARSDGDRRAHLRKGRLPDGQARRLRTSMLSSSTMRLRSTPSCSWKISAFAKRAKAAPSSAADGSRPRAALPSTPMAADCPIVIRACTGCSC